MGRFDQLSAKERALLSQVLAGRRHTDPEDTQIINNLLMELGP